jgi:hypothetical protein
MGWIGPADTVENFLAVENADRDSEGRFIIRGDQPPVSFLGRGDELVLDDTLVYFKHGRAIPLVSNMVATLGQGGHRGLSVVVI